MRPAIRLQTQNGISNIGTKANGLETSSSNVPVDSSWPDIHPETVENPHLPGPSEVHGSSDDIRKNDDWFASIRYSITTQQYERLLPLGA